MEGAQVLFPRLFFFSFLEERAGGQRWIRLRAVCCRCCYERLCSGMYANMSRHPQTGEGAGNGGGPQPQRYLLGMLSFYFKCRFYFFKRN